MTARTSLLVLLVAAPTVAADVDKPRLRKLAKLPSISIYTGFYFSTIHGFSLNQDKPAPRVEIARLRKQLKGDASDAERYLRLGLLYDDKKDSEAAYAQAVALYRQQAKEHPEDMGWLARLGDALVRSGADAEGEKLLRRVIKETPKEWRGWLALARCVDEQADQALMGDKRFSLRLHDHKVLMPALAEAKPTAEQIARMRQLHKEALRYYDRAVALAPKEKEPYLRRAASHWFAASVEAGLRQLKGEKVNVQAMLLSPRCAADVRQLAKLSPDDPKAIGSAMLLDIMACVLHGKIDRDAVKREASVARAEKTPLMDLLPAEIRTFVQWGMKRLEQLTNSNDKGTAAAASEMLADVLITFERMGLTSSPSSRLAAIGKALPPPLGQNAPDNKKPISKIAKLYMKAVRLDPSRDRAWDALTLQLIDEEQSEEALHQAGERLKIKDNAHNRFVLAKIHADNGHFDKVAEQLRLGLKSDANDLNCLLGLVAVLLRRENAEALKEAGERLDAVEPALKQAKKEQRSSYRLLRGIHAALSDRPEKASALFKQHLRQDAGSITAAKALAALGQPLTTEDEALAIAYLREQKAEIKRAEGWFDKSVVRIDLRDDTITDEDMFFLSAFPQLRELRLSSDAITDGGLVYLDRLPELQRLYLHCRKITDKGLAHLQALKHLRSLDLDTSNLSDNGMAHLEALTELEELSIDEPMSFSPKKPRITDVGLAHLRKLPHLRDLSLSLAIDDKGLAQVTALPKLRRMWLSGGKFTDEGMKHFAQCRGLRKLSIGNVDITGSGLAHLQQLQHLRELDLSFTKVADAGLAHVKKLTQLESLNLLDTAVTDAGLAHLSGLTNLRELNLGGPIFSPEWLSMSFFGDKPAAAKKPAKPAISDAGLKHLRALTKLETLKLDKRGITDAGLADLQVLPRLRILSLNNTGITDAGLPRLQGFPRLKDVRLRETKVTSKGVAELRKKCPELQVVIDP